ncbi:MAG: M20/M25/M40 family metallo-hydrolase [Oscillospiraceae bacterium]|jgi:endoglucanase|nr:M20/M25/M40 family metallo-hydrolase [Oscillospiraceae bacterium]
MQRVPETPTGKRNLIVRKLLFDAHIDEVGVIITEYSDGFARLAAIGTPDVRALPASEVEFALPDGSRAVAVISALPPHLTGGGGNAVAAIEELYADTGGVPIPVGTFGTFRSQFTSCGDLVVSKSLDNRASAAVLLDVLRRLEGETLAVELTCMFSAQEEVGLRGAAVGARGVSADLAVVVDVTFGQSPETRGYDSFTLGSGVTIGVGPAMNREFTERVRKIADAHSIPYRVEVLPSRSGTNSDVIQLAGAGAATALISIPVRYMHSPVETLDLRDLQAASDLLYHIAKEVT